MSGKFAVIVALLMGPTVLFKTIEICECEFPAPSEWELQSIEYGGQRGEVTEGHEGSLTLDQKGRGRFVLTPIFDLDVLGFRTECGTGHRRVRIEVQARSFLRCRCGTSSFKGIYLCVGDRLTLCVRGEVDEWPTEL